MRRHLLPIVLLAAVLAVGGWAVARRLGPGPLTIPGAQPAPESIRLDFEPYVDGLDEPVSMTHAGDGSGRMFVLEKFGRIRVVQDGAVLERPFLDVSDRMVRLNERYDERGLLGLAFHPDYAENGRLFIYYSAPLRTGGPPGWNHTIHLSEFRVSDDDPNRADPGSEIVVLQVDQPQGNHNGGEVVFGPDGYLYLSPGDGGAANDNGTGHPEEGNGQWGDTLLGKLLRIDVDAPVEDAPYGIPEDNPFLDDPVFRNEIWAYGLRNAWRFSFDRATGDLYIADVGQNEWEEVNFQPADSAGGENYGWKIMEGTHCFSPSRNCPTEGLVQPVAEYQHRGGDCSVTGGFVYRGPAYPKLEGSYFFSDYCTGKVWALNRETDDGGWWYAVVGQTGMRVTAFGQAEDGELYLAGSNGDIVRLVDADAGAAPTDTPAPPTPVPTDAPTATATEVPVEPTPTEEVAGAGLLVPWTGRD